MFDMLPSSTLKSGLLIVSIILGFLFIMVLIKLSYKILNTYQDKRKFKNPDKDFFSFGPINFWLIKKRFNLTFLQMKKLQTILGKIKIPTAKVLLINKEIAFFYFRQYVELLFNELTNKDTLNELMDNVLELCPHFISTSEEIETTKSIKIDTEFKITNEFGKKFITRAVDVNSRHILIKIPKEIENETPALEDMILNISFNNEQDAYYEFTTFVLGTKKTGNVTFLMLAHSAKMERSQRRKSIRRNSEIEAMFYLLTVYKYEGQEKIMLHKKTMAAGYVKNISKNGFCILTKNSEVFDKDKLIKIELKLNGKTESLVAKIKRKRTIHQDRQCYLNIEIIKQVRSTERNIEAFVYNINPYFENNKCIKEEKKETTTSQDRMLELLKKKPLLVRAGRD
jgi:c-di-GMP-binding flagellar brake protein YcgR